MQEDLATTLTQATAAVCAGIGAAPVPFADTIPLTALQAGLVAGIAWIGGRSVDRKGASEFMGAAHRQRRRRVRPPRERPRSS